MQYRKMGRWGLLLSVIGLSSYLTFVHSLDLQKSRTIIRKAYDGGVNFFDTADIFAFGRAEEVLGKCLCEFERSSNVLLTKCWERLSVQINVKVCPPNISLNPVIEV
jgi:aryl-alcohol dehydrogenase-like predicted oxidoreductase